MAQHSSLRATAAHSDDYRWPELSQRPTTFRYLGSLEFWQNGSAVELRGTIQRTLFATLLAAGSRPVSTSTLVEELWNENPPATAENSLQAHISRLRRKLYAAGRGESSCLLSLPSGYQLLVSDPDDVDAIRFLRILNEARARAVADPTEAIGKLRAALSLWRGPAFGGPIGGPICQATAARCEADRSIAYELLFDLEIRCGRHSEVIPELSELVESASLNERICEQLMVALYRSGRQTEALETYRRIRNRLDDELGVEPSPTLRRFEQAILTHDPVLGAGANHVALRG